MRTRSVRTASAVVAVFALVFAGCGGDDDEASTEISAALDEFQFEPDSWTVPAGQEITVTIENDGTVEHEWVLLKPGVTIENADELPEDEETLLADFVYVEDEVEPGEETTFTFRAPSVGSYQVICAIPGHFDAGMEGTLEAVE